MLLMPMLYLPPLSYMALLCASGEVTIEAQENYIKSTYRNRCEIMGSNGPIEMSLPLIGGRDHHQPYREAQIAYTSDWQHRHRMSILSCYGSAPFFEHYMPHLEPFYAKQYPNLFLYNKDLLLLLIRVLRLDVKLSYTRTYEKTPADLTDMRMAFKPDKTINEITIGQEKCNLREVPYMHTFEGVRTSLNLSILDLLFNEGPQAKNVLMQMVVRS